jgi:hypothetical protein
MEAREVWVRDWPGQVVLCVSQMSWTEEIHEAIRIGGAPGLKNYYIKLNDQLMEIVALVRGKLTKQQRITLGALVVIDVHSRDVTLDMADKGRSPHSQTPASAELISNIVSTFTASIFLVFHQFSKVDREFNSMNIQRRNVSSERILILF